MARALILVVSIALVACGGDGDDEPPAPPPTAAPAPLGSMVTVHASSSPPGATVTGGGRVLGVTPLTTQVPVPAAEPEQVNVFPFVFRLPEYRPATINASPINGQIFVMATLAPIAATPPPDLGGAAVAPPSANPFRRGDAWRGSYVCSQGPTSMVLRITGVRGNRIDATFDFDHRPSRTSGSFRMSGRFEPSTRRLVLNPRQWIRQPPGWRTVGMSGRVDPGGRTYGGRITGLGGCTRFRVVL